MGCRNLGFTDCVTEVDESRDHIAEEFRLRGADDEEEYICSLITEICGDRLLCKKNPEFEIIKSYVGRWGISQLLFDLNLAIPKHVVKKKKQKPEPCIPPKKKKKQCKRDPTSFKVFRKYLAEMPVKLLQDYERIMNKKGQDFDFAEARGYLKQLKRFRFKKRKFVSAVDSCYEIRPLPWNKMRHVLCDGQNASTSDEDKLKREEEWRQKCRKINGPCAACDYRAEMEKRKLRKKRIPVCPACVKKPEKKVEKEVIIKRPKCD